MTTAKHEDDTFKCPNAQGYSVTPHAAHIWHDKGRKVLCEGCR